MEKEKLGTILKHTKKAFEDICLELVSQEMSACEDFIIGKDHKMAVIVSMSGEHKGRLHLECDMTTANKVAVAMNFGDPLDKEDDLYVYLAEFGNMVSGRAATYINDDFKQRIIWLSPPAIFSGKNLEIINPTVQSETACYKGESGRFLLDIGFEGVN